MNNDPKDILSKLNNNNDQDKLIDYLNHHLTDPEQHEFESQMNEDEFVNDAVEGLEQLKNKKDILKYTGQLNITLQKQLEKRNRKKEKRKLPSLRWTYLSVILLLLLIVIAYIILKKTGQ